MLNWLLTQLVPLTLLLIALLSLRPLLLSYLGGRLQYTVWLAVPLLLLWSFLPKDLFPSTNLLIYRVPLNVQPINAELPSGDLWPVALMIAWLMGVVAMAVGVWQQYRQLAKTLKSATKSNLQDFSIPCRHSSGLQGPFVTGLICPTVLLPVDFKHRFDAEQQQLILQHELKHWQRGDLHANLLALMLLGLFWFHPLCWLAYRAYRQDQELACDAAVLAHASSQQKIAYSYALLSNVQNRPPHWQLLSNHYGDKKMMKQRLQLLQRQQGFSKTALALTLSALIGMTLWLQQPVQAADAADDIKPIMRVEPRYPLVAAQAKIEGYIVAEFDIQPDGQVKNIQVLKSVPAQVFDKEAVRALQQWAYSPSATGVKRAKVQLDFMMDPVSEDIERVEVSTKH